jgi:hypothetical protein
VETSKPTGAEIVIFVFKYSPLIVRVCVPDAIPAHALNDDKVPADVIVGCVLEHAKEVPAGASK